MVQAVFRIKEDTNGPARMTTDEERVLHID